MYNTPIHGLPAPDQLAPDVGPDVPADLKALADAIDSKLTPYSQGNGSPADLGIAPGKIGRRHEDLLTGDEYLDIGSGWVLKTPQINPAANVAGLRTLGNGALEAAAGDDPRLSDDRPPLDGSVDASKIAAVLKPSAGAAAAVEALRALGVVAGTAAAGNDARLLASQTVRDRLNNVTAFISTLLDDPDASTALSTLGVSAFIKGLLDDADAAAARTTLGMDDLLPWSISLDVFGSAAAFAVLTGFATISVNAPQIKNGYLVNGGGAQNDQVGWDIPMAAGTWNLTVLGAHDADSGIITASIDGANIGTIDQYQAGGTAYNRATDIVGFNVNATGKKRLLLKMATKNAASAAYKGRLTSVILRRTA